MHLLLLKPLKMILLFAIILYELKNSLIQRKKFRRKRKKQLVLLRIIHYMIEINPLRFLIKLNLISVSNLRFLHPSIIYKNLKMIPHLYLLGAVLVVQIDAYLVIYLRMQVILSHPLLVDVLTKLILKIYIWIVKLIILYILFLVLDVRCNTLDEPQDLLIKE